MKKKISMKWKVGQQVVRLSRGILNTTEAHLCKVTRVGVREFAVDDTTTKYRVSDGRGVGLFSDRYRVEPLAEGTHRLALDATRASELCRELRYANQSPQARLAAALPHLEAAHRALRGE